MNTKLETLWEEAFGRKPTTMQERMFLHSVRKHISEEEDFTLSRLESWLLGSLEPAQTKFTAGKLRNIAREIEQQRIKPITQETEKNVLALHIVAGSVIDFEVGKIVDCKKEAETADLTKPSKGTREEYLTFFWLEFGFQFAVMPKDKSKLPFHVTHYLELVEDDGKMPF